MQHHLPLRRAVGAARVHVGGVAAPKKKPLRVNDLQGLLEWLAEWTGLEPATPGVTGRYSNQLNYHSTAGSHRPNTHQPSLAAGFSDRSASPAQLGVP